MLNQLPTIIRKRGSVSAPWRHPVAWLFVLAVGIGIAGCSHARKEPRKAEGAAISFPPQEPSKPPLTPEEIERLEQERTKVIEDKAEAFARYATGLSLELQGDSDQALEEFLRAASNDPSFEHLVMEVSRSLLKQGQGERAYLLLKKAAGDTNASMIIHAQFGWVCAQMGRKDEAMAANARAIQKDPAKLPGYQNQFFLYLQDKKYKAAWQVLEAAEQQGKDAAFLLDLAEMFAKYRQSVPDEAEQARERMVKTLDRARELKPAGLVLQLKLADGYGYAGETRKAADLYLAMQEEFANLPAVRDSIREKLTNLYLRNQDRKKAAEQLEAIVKDYPLNAQAYYYLGGLAFDDKNFERAIEYLGKAILLSPKFEQGYYDLAAAQINTNRTRDALGTLEKARAQFGQTFTLEYYTGLVHSRDKNYGAAVKALIAAEVIAGVVDEKRLTPLFYFTLGSNCERNKQLEEAEKYLQKAIDLDPNFAEALNYLGYTWAEHGINLDRAKTYLDRALRLEPKNAAFLDSMGWIYFKKGNFPKALDYIEKAIELMAEPDATLYEHLGDIHAAMKQWEKARQAYERSLAVEKNDAVSKKLEALPAK